MTVSKSSSEWDELPESDLGMLAGLSFLEAAGQLWAWLWIWAVMSVSGILRLLRALAVRKGSGISLGLGLGFCLGLGFASFGPCPGVDAVSRWL